MKITSRNNSLQKAIPSRVFGKGVHDVNTFVIIQKAWKNQALKAIERERRRSPIKGKFFRFELIEAQAKNIERNSERQTFSTIRSRSKMSTKWAKKL